MTRKILFIHHGGGIGGAPISMLQLVAALDPERYEPRVYFSQPGPIIDLARDMGVHAEVYPLFSAFFYGAHVPMRLRMLVRFLSQFWSTMRATRTLVRRERPDLIHLNTSVLVPAAVAVKREGIPLVWHSREAPGPNPWLRRWHVGIMSRLSDRIVAASRFVGEAFTGLNEVNVVHNSVDLEDYMVDKQKVRASVRREFGLTLTAPVVGMLGTVQTVKGHDLLLRAAQRVVRQVPDARFLIITGGVDEAYRRSWRGRVKRALRLPLDNLERMRRRVETLGMQDHFVFTGFRMDIPELMAAIDVLTFLPQAPEGFGRPLIEAMAIGSPIVASDIGPTREIMGEETGLLVRPGDERELAEALINLLTDPPMRADMGRAGRERVESMFTLDRQVELIQRLYDEVIEQRTATSPDTVEPVGPDADRKIKQAVSMYWDQDPCGSFASDSLPGSQRFYEQVASYRYASQPFMKKVVGFDRHPGLRVLEVGCGLGTDLLQFASGGSSVVGVDLSGHSVSLAAQHFRVFDAAGTFIRSDAEHLPFADSSFDVVYSFGVLHHTPDTQKAVYECYRVLKPGGKFMLMLYHQSSWLVLVEPHLRRARGRLLREKVPAGLTDPLEVVRRYDGADNPYGGAYDKDDVLSLLHSFADVRLQVRSPSFLSSSWSHRAYDRLLQLSGINRRWGFWIMAQARRPTDEDGSGSQ